MSKSFESFTLFFKNASEKGILLLGACLLAVILSNCNFSSSYHAFLNLSIVDFQPLGIQLNLFHFTNDFLMAIFFLLVGLDIKNEILYGHLSTRKERILPIVAAIGGVIVPILIYSLFTYNNKFFWKGWAIPAATDIAFSLGVLALFGKKLPASLRVFLTALAIIDDLIAVIIIALFYSEKINLGFLTVGLLLCLSMCLKPKQKRINNFQLLIYGLGLWFCFYKSGIHSTIAGITLAMLIPSDKPKIGVSKLEEISKTISPWVLYLILPLFAFINSGISISGNWIEYLFHPISLGIIIGLFVGKQLGIFSISYILIKTKIATLPRGANFLQFYSVALMCGIGFTMSLFIGNLSFNHEQPLLNYARVGVLTGSILSMMAGATILKTFDRKR